MKIIFSDQYCIDIGHHPWRTDKYAEAVRRVKESVPGKALSIVEAPMAEDEDILRVHTPEFWKKLCEADFSNEEAQLLELPVSRSLIDLFRRMTGGTVRATELALEEGLCVHAGGGFHHGFPNQGTGFCLINDIAVGVRSVIERGMAGRVAVIDCDLHQGDGTAWIFRDDPDVSTLSIHQARNFPDLKRHSTIDIELEDGTEDGPYLRRLAEGLDRLFDGHGSFDLVHYQAGADPYKGDLLGGLSLSIEGIRKRDRMVLERTASLGIPTILTFGGGYAESFDDLVQIHANTVLTALRMAEKRPHFTIRIPSAIP
ncbi:MAG TPA: histone deacetylase [Acidobacteriota bacterium]|nr:histone deacetylase [Acidobacteriota bacterium]